MGRAWTETGTRLLSLLSLLWMWERARDTEGMVDREHGKIKKLCQRPSQREMGAMSCDIHPNLASYCKKVYSLKPENKTHLLNR